MPTPWGTTTRSMLPQNSALAVADLSTKTEATLAAGPPVSGVTAEEFVHHYEDRMLANRTERTRMWGKMRAVRRNELERMTHDEREDALRANADDPRRLVNDALETKFGIIQRGDSVAAETMVALNDWKRLFGKTDDDIRSFIADLDDTSDIRDWEYNKDCDMESRSKKSLVFIFMAYEDAIKIQLLPIREYETFVCKFNARRTKDWHDGRVRQTMLRLSITGILPSKLRREDRGKETAERRSQENNAYYREPANRPSGNYTRPYKRKSRDNRGNQSLRRHERRNSDSRTIAILADLAYPPRTYANYNELVAECRRDMFKDGMKAYIEAFIDEVVCICNLESESRSRLDVIKISEDFEYMGNEEDDAFQRRVKDQRIAKLRDALARLQRMRSDVMGDADQHGNDSHKEKRPRTMGSSISSTLTKDANYWIMWKLNTIQGQKRSDALQTDTVCSDTMSMKSESIVRSDPSDKRTPWPSSRVHRFYENPSLAMALGSQTGGHHLFNDGSSSRTSRTSSFASAARSSGSKDASPDEWELKKSRDKFATKM